MIDLSELSENERFEYLLAMIREGKGPRAGRPNKHSEVPRWRDFGLTRKQVWRMRRLAEIPNEDFQAFLDLNLTNGKRSSYRAIFVHFGKLNVPTENDFDGTPLGDLARSLLAPCERLLDSDSLDERERRILKRALSARFQQICRARKPPPRKHSA
jgi:hypothetical protein